METKAAIVASRLPCCGNHLLDHIVQGQVRIHHNRVFWGLERGKLAVQQLLREKVRLPVPQAVQDRVMIDVKVDEIHRGQALMQEGSIGVLERGTGQDN